MSIFLKVFFEKCLVFECFFKNSWNCNSQVQDFSNADLSPMDAHGSHVVFENKTRLRNAGAAVAEHVGKLMQVLARQARPEDAQKHFGVCCSCCR